MSEPAMETLSEFGNMAAIKELQEVKLRQLEAVLPNPNKKKSTYSFKELHDKKDEVQKFLIPELLPAGAVTVLIGEDGIGKTQIMTQLCLSIAFHFNTFLGLPLQPESNECLIVATEEGKQKFTSAIMKQAYTLNPNLKPEDVHISFTEGSDFDDFITLKEEIEFELNASKKSLMVIDAMSDLFTLIDGDINSNSHARKLLSFFQHLCNVYEGLAIVIIHHAAKTKITAKHKEGKLFVEKNDAQGAGAITQKARTVLALTNDPKTVSSDGSSYTNYFHVVKANLMGKHYQKNAIQAQFTAENLLHKAMGLVDVELHLSTDAPAATAAQVEAGNARKATPQELSDDQHYDVLDKIFANTTALSRADLISGMRTWYGVGQSKIELKDGYLNYCVDKKFIEKGAMGYRYNKPTRNPKTTQQNLTGEFDEGFEEATPF
jgi:RecA-family ATPase